MFLDWHCERMTGRYSNLIFISRFRTSVTPGDESHLSIITACNDKRLLKNESAKVLLPHFI